MGKTRKTAVKEAFGKSYDAMRTLGFAISGEVRIVVDSNLPIMGYTFSRKDAHVIVVSESALDSGLLEGLLVHEMSHIYLAEKNHPSHDNMEDVLKGFVEEDYRGRVIHDLVNHVKNIYADDVAFKVFEEWQEDFSGDTIRGFFLNWIKTEPASHKASKQSRWLNGSVMVSNAFATATVNRHGIITGFEEEFERRNASFLGRIDGGLARNFDYFKDYFVKLEPETNEALFRRRLSEYLRRFTQMTEE